MIRFLTFMCMIALEATLPSVVFAGLQPHTTGEEKECPRGQAFEKQIRLTKKGETETIFLCRPLIKLQDDKGKQCSEKGRVAYQKDPYSTAVAYICADDPLLEKDKCNITQNCTFAALKALGQSETSILYSDTEQARMLDLTANISSLEHTPNLSTFGEQRLLAQKEELANIQQSGIERTLRTLDSNSIGTFDSGKTFTALYENPNQSYGIQAGENKSDVVITYSTQGCTNGPCIRQVRADFVPSYLAPEPEREPDIRIAENKIKGSSPVPSLNTFAEAPQAPNIGQILAQYDGNGVPENGIRNTASEQFTPVSLQTNTDQGVWEALNQPTIASTLQYTYENATYALEKAKEWVTWTGNGIASAWHETLSWLGW